ncbi:MAG: M20/M25/M40 family metallo-hydrolase, partial [Gemmatimonadota bacterium]|nr:M20/M25/M40 family metallo-hydrolase [Gemmatimonadota bacterium]
RARAIARATDGDTLRDQLELVQIPAPSLAEAERGAEVARRLRLLGVEGVDVDGVGNVTGTLAHAGAEVPPLIVAAHLDTIFPADTPLQLRRRSGRWCAPGIADNTRGLAGLLALARALGGAGVRTARPVVLVASVGEEGRGDLRGVKHLFRGGSPYRHAAAFISLDGSGLGRIVMRAVGSRRLRVTARGPGGHSWADRGTPNPVQALGAAVQALGEHRPPPEAPASLTIARIQGGMSVNSIPAAAWMEIDLRAEDGGVLARMEAEVRVAVAASSEAEGRNRAGAGDALTLLVEVIGDRPSGEADAASALVRLALGVTEALGERAELSAASTDANVPISLGIPSVTVGAGGDSGGVHTTDEWYDNRRGAIGVERALLLVMGAAGVAG